MITVTENSKDTEIKICGMFEEEKNEMVPLFYGKEGEIYIFPSQNQLKLVIGLGKEEKLTIHKIRNWYAKAIKEIKKYPIKTIQLNGIETDKLNKKVILKAMLEGIYLADYSYKGYRTNSKSQIDREIILNGFEDVQELKNMVEQIKNLAESINQARDMILEPANLLFSQTLADRVKQIAEESGLECTILNEEEIKELGMNAFLAVAKGSSHPPKLIVLRYYNSNGPVLGLVGKGIMYDTGGYCLKPGVSLQHAKGDMAGAATAIAIMRALAKNRCTVNIVAVIACCDNVIAGNSYLPGDVVTSMSKKTIEILNTDAEGRLTLADALSYIIEVEKVDQVIDIATLTGMAGRTFGSLYTPAFTNNDTFFMQFMQAAEKAGEDYWKMPCDPRYHSYIESKVADIKNTGEAGTITAAMFLKEFVKDTPWIHLDIAATAQQKPAVFEYAADCPSGIAIRTIYEMVQQEPISSL